MATYRVTIINHCKALTFMVIGTCLMIATLSYFDFDSTSVKVFAAFWIIYTVPALALHAIYFLEDKSKEILIEGEHLTVSENNKIVVETTFSELACITVFCSKNRKDFGIQQLPCESYYYLILHLKDGNSIVCTCLIFAGIKNTRRIFRRTPIMFKYALFNDIKARRVNQKSARITVG